MSWAEKRKSEFRDYNDIPIIFGEWTSRKKTIDFFFTYVENITSTDSEIMIPENYE